MECTKRGFLHWQTICQDRRTNKRLFDHTRLADAASDVYVLFTGFHSKQVLPRINELSENHDETRVNDRFTSRRICMGATVSSNEFPGIRANVQQRDETRQVSRASVN